MPRSRPFIEFKSRTPAPYFPPVPQSEIPVSPEKRLLQYESDNEPNMTYYSPSRSSRTRRRRRRRRSRQSYRPSTFHYSPPPSDEEVEENIRYERKRIHDAAREREEAMREKHLRGLSEREYGWRDKQGRPQQQPYPDYDHRLGQQYPERPYPDQHQPPYDRPEYPNGFHEPERPGLAYGDPRRDYQIDDDEVFRRQGRSGYMQTPPPPPVGAGIAAAGAGLAAAGAGLAAAGAGPGAPMPPPPPPPDEGRMYYPEPVPFGTYPRMNQPGVPGPPPDGPHMVAPEHGDGRIGGGYPAGMQGGELESEELNTEERYEALMRQRRRRRRRHRKGRHRRRRRHRKHYEEEEDDEGDINEEIQGDGKNQEEGEQGEGEGAGAGFNIGNQLTKRNIFKGAMLGLGALAVGFAVKKVMNRRKKKQEEEDGKLDGTSGSHVDDMQYHEGDFRPPLPKAGMFSVVVPENQVCIVERGGKYHRKLGPGSNSLFPCVDSVAYCHTLKEMTMPVPDQTCYTIDNVQINVNAFLSAKIEDPVRASYDVDNPYRAIVLLAQTLLRNEISDMTVANVLENRNAISDRIWRQANDACRPWGMRCVRFELHELEPPPNFKESMEREAEAERQRRYQVLQSEAERQAAINRAEAQLQAQVKLSQARQIEIVNQAIGEAHAITERGEAIANAMREVAQVVREPGGEQAMQMRIAEQYIHAYRNASRAPVVPPPDPNDVAQTVNNAMGLIHTLGDGTPNSPTPPTNLPPNPFAGPSNNPDAPVPTVYPEDLNSFSGEHIEPAVYPNHHAPPVPPPMPDEPPAKPKNFLASKNFEEGNGMKYPPPTQEKKHTNRNVKNFSQQSTPKSKYSASRGASSDRTRHISPLQGISSGRTRHFSPSLGESSDRTRRSDRTGDSDRTRRSDRTRDSVRSKRSNRSRRSSRTRRSDRTRDESSFQNSSRGEE